MLKLTKTGIGLLTKQYKSVLKKCLIANLCILYPLTSDAQYATLYGDNIFTLPVGRIEFLHDSDGGIIKVVNSEGKTSTHIGNQSDDDGYLSVFSHTGSSRVVLEGETEGGSLGLYSGSNVVTTQLTSSSFKLNGSSSATGIDFATNVTAGTTNASHLATTGAVNQLLNYYYTKTEADARYVKIIGDSIIGGLSSSADGILSVTIGQNSQTHSSGDISLGYGAKSSGFSSVSIGDNSNAYVNYSIAIGMHAYASEESSIALGRNSTANESNVLSVGHSIGDYNFTGETTYSSNLYRRIVNMAEGIGDHDAVTVSQLGNIAAETKILNANGESAITFGTGSGQTTVGTAISTLANQLYNYYYTFRGDERTEVIEFAKELRSNKKEMSSLDFMPIKSSSDLRINLIKAEDSLTFSAKTRDDSLVLMEV